MLKKREKSRKCKKNVPIRHFVDRKLFLRVTSFFEKKTFISLLDLHLDLPVYGGIFGIGKLYGSGRLGIITKYKNIRNEIFRVAKFESKVGSRRTTKI